MNDGRSVLVGANPLVPESSRGGGRNTRSIGLFNELRLIEGRDERVILVEGRYQNRFFDEESGLVITRVEPFYRYLRHAVPPQFQTMASRKRNTNPNSGRARWVNLPCSAGSDPSSPKPCLACQIGSDKVAARPRKVFTVIHLHPYHLFQRKNSQETYPKLCLADFEDRTCPGCEQGLETIQAARRYIEFTIPDYEVLVAHNQRLRSKCVCGGRLGTTAFVCPQCGQELLKFSPETKEEFAKVAKTGKYYCQKCGIPVQVSERKACSNRCENPRALDVFNTILTLNKARTEKQFMQIMIPESEPAAAMLEQYSALAQPLDLAATFAVDPVEQRKTIAVPNRQGMEDYSEPRE